MDTHSEINPSSTTDNYTPVVSRYMSITEITWGDTRNKYLVRYRGKILGDPTEAFDKLAEIFRLKDITPIFRVEDNRQTILLLKQTQKPKPSNPWINLTLFLLTLVSVLLAGTLYSYDGIMPSDPRQIGLVLIANLDIGLPFALSLLAILLAHEFGHYLAGRYHKTAVTLPYFIPFPFSLFGTMGAFIQIKEPPKNKRVLLDIGIAGPIAGLIVAIPILLIGLSLSTLERIPLNIPSSQQFNLEGNSILYLLSKYAVFKDLLPHPAHYSGLPPLIYWFRYFITGNPIPLGGIDVFLHPMAWAGWAGLLVTALNLIPAGQLDGGHIVFSLMGTKVNKLRPIILGATLLMGLIWSGWWLWAMLIFFLGGGHAETLDQITTLDSKRRALAIAGLLIFILVFTPVPLKTVMGS